MPDWLTEPLIVIHLNALYVVIALIVCAAFVAVGYLLGHKRAANEFVTSRQFTKAMDSKAADLLGNIKLEFESRGLSEEGARRLQAVAKDLEGVLVRSREANEKLDMSLKRLKGLRIRLVDQEASANFSAVAHTVLGLVIGSIAGLSADWVLHGGAWLPRTEAVGRGTLLIIASLLTTIVIGLYLVPILERRWMPYFRERAASADIEDPEGNVIQD